MRIVKHKTIKEFYETDRYRDAKGPLEAWYKEAVDADWSSPHDIKLQYRSADPIGDNRIVFNIGGNKYRLIVKFNYVYRIGYIRFVGTHRQYDRIKAEEI